MMDRLVPSGIVEQWMTHLRLQRSRANDMIWLIEQGATLHDGRNGEPLHDATDRWLTEQREVVADVNRLEELYKDINERGAFFGRGESSGGTAGPGKKKPSRH
jgi:post-segregation antitoxin (ccd killing protein)